MSSGRPEDNDEDHIAVAPVELMQIAKKQLRPTSRFPFRGISRRSLHRAAERIERQLLRERARADPPAGREEGDPSQFDAQDR